MPRYTFECKRCRTGTEVVMGMEETARRKRMLCGCGRRMRRVFVAPEVIQDTIPEVALSSLPDLEGRVGTPKMRTNSRTAIKRRLHELNTRNGWKLEEAG